MTDFTLAATALQQVQAYRVMYALCDLKGDTLKATYMACVLTQGRNPLWGIFSVATGELIRFAGRRSQIEDFYPNKAWRRITSRWTLQSVSSEMTSDDMKEWLHRQINGKVPEPDAKPPVTPREKLERVVDNPL